MCWVHAGRSRSACASSAGTAEALDEARSLRLAHRNRLGREQPADAADHPESRQRVARQRVGGRGRARRRRGLQAIPGAVSGPSLHRCLRWRISRSPTGRPVGSQRGTGAQPDGARPAQGRVPPRHPYALCCATNLANDLAASGRHGCGVGALARRRMSCPARFVSLTRRIFRRTPIRPRLHEHYAVDLITTGNDAEGQALQRQALDLMSRHPDLGEGHPDTKSVRDGRRLPTATSSPRRRSRAARVSPATTGETGRRTLPRIRLYRESCGCAGAGPVCPRLMSPGDAAFASSSTLAGTGPLSSPVMARSSPATNRWPAGVSSSPAPTSDRAAATAPPGVGEQACRVRMHRGVTGEGAPMRRRRPETHRCLAAARRPAVGPHATVRRTARHSTARAVRSSR